MNRFYLLLAILLLPAFPARAVAAGKLNVVTFSTVLTEIASQIGGDRATVTGLIKPGVDPHEYQPAPDDLKAVSAAQLILASGKHLEGYLDKLPQSTGSGGEVLRVGDRLPTLRVANLEDPHWWHSIDNVKKATEIVRDAMIQLDPADRETFENNADVYLASLDALKKWANLKLAELPRDHRKLVTSHDAFQYFARDYGFTVYAIEGLTTEDEPSSRDVATLIDTIRAQGVKAIFLESTVNPKVTTAIIRETGVKIGGALYADGPGVDAGAETYAGMVKHNVSTIVDALK